MDKPLSTVNLDGIDYPTAPEVKNSHQKLQASLKEATVNLDALQAKHDVLKSELDAYKQEFNADSIAAAVNARVALMAEASKVINMDAMDGKTDRQIQEAVVMSKHSDINFDGKSDDYVRASYDMVMKAVPSKEAEALGKQKQAVNQAMNADAAPVHRSQAALYNDQYHGGAK